MKKMDASQTRQIVLLVILVLVGIWAAFRWMGPEGLGGPGSTVKEPEWQAHPLPKLVSVEGIGSEAAESGESRNPFVFGPPPTPTPNLTPPPTPIPRATRPPRAPRPTPTPTPPGYRKPPNFDMEYIGFFGPEGRHVAVFRKQEDDGAEIEVASIGGVVEDQFILRSIDLESVVIGFVGFPEKEKTRVPLAEK